MEQPKLSYTRHAYVLGTLLEGITTQSATPDTGRDTHADVHPAFATPHQKGSTASLPSVGGSSDRKSPVASAVAIVGGNKFADIDDAIAAAADDATIILLADVQIKKSFSKSLTFQGGHRIYASLYGWDYEGILTLDRAAFELRADATALPAQDGRGTRWYAMRFIDGSGIHAANEAEVTISYDSLAGITCALYTETDDDAFITVENRSTFSVNCRNARSSQGCAIQLGSTYSSFIKVAENSSFLINGADQGITGSSATYIETSRFTIQNCASDGFNGGMFTSLSSTLTFQNNQGTGLVAQTPMFVGSQVTFLGNGHAGLDVTGDLKIMRSTVTVCDNGWNSRGAESFAGIRTQGNSTIDAASFVDIERNYVSGWRAQSAVGTTVFQGGCRLTVMDNGMKTAGREHGIFVDSMARWFTANGGGIFNRGTLVLPKTAKICNNHAINAGDDIYSTGGITFHAVSDYGEPWCLNGGVKHHNLIDCIDPIDAWYDDSKDARWSVHDDREKVLQHVVIVEPGAYTQELALKAAHGYRDTLRLDANGGQGTMGIIYANWNSMVIIPTHIFKHPGYTFAGWNTKPDGTGDAYEDGGYYTLTPEDDVLYAQWKETKPKAPKPVPKPQIGEQNATSDTDRSSRLSLSRSKRNARKADTSAATDASTRTSRGPKHARHAAPAGGASTVQTAPSAKAATPAISKAPKRGRHARE